MNRAAVLLLLLAACTTAAPPVSDWERKNAERLALTPEDRPALPPYPKKNDLVEIYVSATTNFKYFVDASTLSVAPKQREVRYVLLARSPSGVENVSYEVIRCPDQYRVLAVGQRDGRWGGQPGDWREITKGASLSWPYALSRNYFCPHRDPIQTAAEGADALHNGAHRAVEVQRSMGGY